MISIMGIKKTVRGTIPIELRPRYCLLQKLPDSPGFGFNLNTSFGKIGRISICRVDPNSPADRAGLLSGDKIVLLNGARISEDRHTLVARYIKESGDCVSLVVVSPEGYTFFSKRWVKPERDYYQYAVCTNPLLQVRRLIKPPGSVGYGMSLRHRADQNVWVGEVEVNSPADRAGVKPGDQILEVNGVNLRGQRKEVVEKKMKMKKNNEVYLTVRTEGREVISSEAHPDIVFPINNNNNTPDVAPREQNFTNNEEPAEPSNDPGSTENPDLPRDVVDEETIPKALLLSNEQENEPENPNNLTSISSGQEYENTTPKTHWPTNLQENEPASSDILPSRLPSITTSTQTDHTPGTIRAIASSPQPMPNPSNPALPEVSQFQFDVFEPEISPSIRRRHDDNVSYPSGFGFGEIPESWKLGSSFRSRSPISMQGPIGQHYPGLQGSPIEEWFEELRRERELTERERREKEEEEERRKRCVVCADREKSYTFIPCGHMACCSICADRLEICPVCRAPVNSTVKTFIP